MGSNINLYLKTEYSLLTSLIKIDDLPQTLKKLGYDVTGSDVAKHFFTEEGLIKNNIPFFEYNANNIKSN